MRRVRYIYSIGMLLIAVALMLAACTKDPVTSQQGEGAIALGVSFDTRTVIPALLASKGDDTPDYTVAVFEADGKKIRQYTKDQLPEQIWLLTGTYTIKAWSGEEKAAEFDAPYYVGEQEIVVAPNEVSTVPLVCTLANAKVSVTYSERLRNNFSSFKTTIGPDVANQLLFDGSPDQVGYYKTEEGTNATKLLWKLDVTNNHGQTYSMNGDFVAQPRHHYTVQFDVPEGVDDPTEGGWIFDQLIVVDDSMEEHDDEISIPLKKCPEITGVDFDIAAGYVLQLGDPVDLRIDLTGTPQIQDLSIEHDCAYLLERGIPAKFFLREAGVDLSVELKDKLNQAGISWTEPYTKITQLNLNTLVGQLGVGSYNLRFDVHDNQGKSRDAALNIAIVQSDVVTIAIPKSGGVRLRDVWAGHATVRGRWVSEQKPDNLAFEYRKASSPDWIRVTNVTVDNEMAKEFSAVLVGLEPGTDYFFRAVANDLPANPQTFTTEIAQHIPNFNFNNWHTAGKVIYATDAASYSNNTYWFDSGNSGTAPLLSVNATTEEKADVNTPGGSAVRMESKVINAVIVTKFAAGNLFIGRYVELSGTSGVKLDFGLPYTSRPTKLRGYFKYTPKVVNNYNSPGRIEKGDNDCCYIYVALMNMSGPMRVDTTKEDTFPNWENDSRVIGFGDFETNQSTGGYQYFEINIEYRNNEMLPNYICFAASSSKYGDYFAGAEGSVLLIDDFELVFE